MFYSDSFSKAYRMGDIISGYTEIVPVYVPNKADNKLDLSISIVPSVLFVILTPCCSIESKVVNIAPLKELEPKFLSSDQLIANFLLINQPISKLSAVGEVAFSKLSEGEKLEFENAIPSYAYFDKFIYDDHSRLKEYPMEKKRGKDDVIKITTGKYMISFKNVVKIQSELFDRSNKNCEKIAELTPSSRQILRNKLVYYYSRIPEEDQPFLG